MWKAICQKKETGKKSHLPPPPPPPKKRGKWERSALQVFFFWCVMSGEWSHRQTEPNRSIDNAKSGILETTTVNRRFYMYVFVLYIFAGLLTVRNPVPRTQTEYILVPPRSLGSVPNQHEPIPDSSRQSIRACSKTDPIKVGNWTQSR